MKTKCLATIAALWVTIDAFAQGSLTLNSGDTYTFEFNWPFSIGLWPRAVPPGAPAAVVTGSLVPASFLPGSVLLFEIFENSTNQPAVASQTLAAQAGGVPGLSFWALHAWQDLQGTIRVSALSGSGTFDKLDVTAILDVEGSLIGYGKSALPMPEPSASLLLSFGLLALALIVPLRPRAFAPWRQKLK